MAGVYGWMFLDKRSLREFADSTMVNYSNDLGIAALLRNMSM